MIPLWEIYAKIATFISHIEIIYYETQRNRRTTGL